MTPVHIEGMGWLGSVLARRLERAGIDFTWHDNDDPFPAWPASTGLVYPTDPTDERSVMGMKGWQRWIHEDPWLADFTERVSVGFVTANPPSGGKYEAVDLGGIKIGQAPCYATDPRAIVTAARERYASARREADPGDPNSILIQAHAHGPRLQSMMWGWSARVKLHEQIDFSRRVAYYGHRMSQSCYAYPIPRTEFFFAGSASFEQRTPKRLDTDNHFALWRKFFLKQFPVSEVELVEPPVQGWRPRWKEGDSLKPKRIILPSDRRCITLPPLRHSGVRWCPPIIDLTVRGIERMS